MENPLKIREELMSAASPKAQKEYIEGLRKYFRGLLSHRELALIVRSALGPHTAIHNRFIRAIFTNAEHKALLEEYGPGYIKDTTKRETPRPAPDPAGQKKTTSAPPLQPAGLRTPAKPVKTMWSVKYPALGNGPPQIQTSLAGGITDLLLDEDSFVAMHNRMLQLCLPTAVDAVSPDAAIMLLHALGAYLKATVGSCPEASMPSSGGRPLHGAHLPPPQPFLHAGGTADQEPEWETLETESELHDRVAREQVASAQAKAQVRLQMRKRQDGHATNRSRLRPRLAVVPVENGDLVACVAQRQEQRLKRKQEQGQGQGPNGRRRLIEIRLESKSEAQVGNEAQNSQDESTNSSAEPMAVDDGPGDKKEALDPATANQEKPAGKGNDGRDDADKSTETDATNSVEKKDEQSNPVDASKDAASRAAQAANGMEEGSSNATNAEKEKEKENATESEKQDEDATANGAKADGHQQGQSNGYSAGNGEGMGIEPPLGFAGRSTLRLPPPRPYPPAGKLGADLEAWSAREVVPGGSMNASRSAGSQATNPSATATSKVPPQQRGKKAAAAAAAAAAAHHQQPFVPASASVGVNYAETEAYKLYPHVTMSDLSMALQKARVHRNAVYGAGGALAGGMR